jgi:hypothetical protein
MLVPEFNSLPRQVMGADPVTLTEVILDEVNLAVWQRALSHPIERFAESLLNSSEPLSQSFMVELNDEVEPDLSQLARAYSNLEGYQQFLSDVSWLVGAYSCLLGARRVGVRLRALDRSMCPRFHVDHVPVRLITTYAGVASEWLSEGGISRSKLGDPAAEPHDPALIHQLQPGDVALFKGEKWLGNEGAGIIHRSPQLPEGMRRLILTLDWLS